MIAQSTLTVCGFVSFAVAGVCAAQLPRADIDACLARLEALEQDVDQNEPLVGDLCPELAAQLTGSVWEQALVDRTIEDLRAADLARLAALAGEYEAVAPPLVATDTLDAALARLPEALPPPQMSWWQRAARWLQERLGSESGDSSWLERWLENVSLPERWARTLVVALGVVLVAATVFVVVNELRVAGVFRRRREEAAAVHGDAGTARRAASVRTLRDLERAPLARRPALLLGLVLERLRRRDAAALRDSLTHRELVGSAGFLDAGQSEALGAVAAAAERATFGAWQPEQREVDELVARGAALLASLNVAEARAR